MSQYGTSRYDLIVSNLERIEKLNLDRDQCLNALESLLEEDHESLDFVAGAAKRWVEDYNRAVKIVQHGDEDI